MPEDGIGLKANGYIVPVGAVATCEGTLPEEAILELAPSALLPAESALANGDFIALLLLVVKIPGEGVAFVPEMNGFEVVLAPDFKKGLIVGA